MRVLIIKVNLPVDLNNFLFSQIIFDSLESLTIIILNGSIEIPDAFNVFPSLEDLSIINQYGNTVFLKGLKSLNNLRKFKRLYLDSCSFPKDDLVYLENKGINVQIQLKKDLVIKKSTLFTLKNKKAI